MRWFGLVHGIGQLLVGLFHVGRGEQLAERSRRGRTARAEPRVFVVIGIVFLLLGVLSIGLAVGD